MLPAQTAVADPVMVVGIAVALVRAIVLAVDAPRQLDAVTDKLPVVNPAANPTVTDVVPCPLWITALAGVVQL